MAIGTADSSPFPKDRRPEQAHSSLVMHRSRRLLNTMNTSRRTISYPRPTTLADRPRPICPGVSYTPLRTPPASPVPSLPARPEVAAPPGWTRSEHPLHAAYPRTFVESTGSLVRELAPFALGPAPEGEDREAKKKRIMGEVKGAITQRLDATMTHEGDGQPALWVAAERWSRANSDSNVDKQEGGRGGQGVSLVLTHANGFTKEVRHCSLHSSGQKAIAHLSELAPGHTAASPTA